ncbi:MAG: metallophosphoesterase, partial [Gemmatimonadota bacterium]
MSTVITGLGLRSASPRVDGEYGLWVEDRRDSLVVHWLSNEPAAGSLSIEANTRKQEFTTTAGTAHTVRFPRPRGASVRLIYGTSAARDTTTIYLQYPRRAATATGGDSIFIFGDTHGEFDTVLKSLHQAGLIGDRHQWTGGRKHLVFAGDLTDRGAEVVPLLWLVYRLEQEAARAGGRVHVVLGNHETMVWMNDLRYVAQKEQSIAAAHGVAYDKMFDIRESVLGKWLMTKPAVLRLDNILFAHGGVGAAWLAYTPQTLDDSLAKFLKEDWFYRYGDTAAFRKVAENMDSATYARRATFFSGESSVFWYRGYVLPPDTAGAT